MTNFQIQLHTKKLVIMNKMQALREEKEELRKNNPWYPVQGISAQLSGYTRQIKELDAQIKKVNVRR
jgi:hypothetical protein